MAKVRVTVEICETLFAYESTSDLIRYAADLVEDGIRQSKEFQDLARPSHQFCCGFVTGVQLVPDREAIWKENHE